ncbi:MAG: class B sortase [Clostridia bacterium]
MPEPVPLIEQGISEPATETTSETAQISEALTDDEALDTDIYSSLDLKQETVENMNREMVKYFNKVYRGKILEFKETNPDTQAVLLIPGVNLFQPIVTCEDNTQYLYLGLDEHYAEGGTIFLDQEIKELPAKNVVLYGNSAINAPLDGITAFKEEEFFTNNDILLYTDSHLYVYAPVAVYETEQLDAYTNVAPENVADIIVEKSALSSARPVKSDSKLLTISTGSDAVSGRLVVQAVQVASYAF